MKESKKLRFNFKPLAIIREFLKIFIEQYFDTDEGKKETDACRFANFVFLKTMTDEELESILYIFAKKEGYKEITFANGEHDFKSIFSVIQELERYVVLENSFIKKGYAGLGVFDEKAQIFYRCELGEHWHTIRVVIREHYSQLYDAFRKLSRMKGITNEYEGITRKELDDFIMTNFTLIGESKELIDYL